MVTEFQDKVYREISKIPEGKVSTYKAIAQRLGINSSQAVGQALKRNPFAPEVPCHRIVASDGFIGGFAGKRTGKRIMDKISLLEKEGIVVEKGMVVDFDDRLWQ